MSGIGEIGETAAAAGWSVDMLVWAGREDPHGVRLTRGEESVYVYEEGGRFTHAVRLVGDRVVGRRVVFVRWFAGRWVRQGARVQRHAEELTVGVR